VEAVIDEENPEQGLLLEDEEALDDDEWLNADELKAGGGWRETPAHKLYWLDVQHLTEYERMNASIETDEEFWDWFGDYARDQKLKPSTRSEGKQRKERGQVAAYKSGDYDWGWKKDESGYSSGGYLRDMWKGWGYSQASSDLTRRLAVALGAVSTTVQAIRTKPGRYRVKLADDTQNNPTSFTSFDEDLVVVSPVPLKDSSLDEQRGIEITTGWALHEAGHTEYTVDVYHDVTQPYVLRPAAVSGMLCNILEDVRIERLVGESFPGFEPYFAWSLEYLWQITAKDAEGNPIERDGRWTGQDLNAKLNWVIRVIRWANEFEPFVDKAVANGDVAAKDEFTWWRAWLADYDEGRIGMRQSLIDALARLAEDPQTEQEMKAQAEQEKAVEQAAGQSLDGITGDQLRDMLKRLIEDMSKGGKQPIMAPCPSPGGPTGVSVKKGQAQAEKAQLNQGEANEIDQLIAELMEVDSPPPHYRDQWHGWVPNTIVRKPLETDPSKGMWAAINQNDPLLQRLKGAFVFRPAAPEYSNRLLKSGQIDDEELYRWKMGDFRVFEQRVIESKPDTDITILIDQSGSMSGQKLRTAVRLCRLMQEILRTTNGTTLRVRSHTNGVDGEDTSMYRIWEPGDPQSRLALPLALPSGANNDGWALGWCIDELLKIGKPSNQKVLFILSDGIPAGKGYSGTPAMDHVRRVTEWGAKQGVVTIQIAVGMYDEESQKRMYANYVVYEDDASIPGKLTKIMSKIL
jgi:hypothetical protein